MGTPKIYTTPTCIFCKKAKTMLDELGVQYEEIDVTTDDGQRELNKLGFKAVPVMIINGQTIKGFNEKQIKTALAM